jgi:alanine racemase
LSPNLTTFDTPLTPRELFVREEQQRAWVEIDHINLVHNVKQIRNLLEPTTSLLAVVKADAYGHGALKVAKTLLKAGANYLAVATVHEGKLLRKSGIEEPILLLGAANSRREIELIKKYLLEPSIVSIEQAKEFQDCLGQLPGKTFPIHLKVDTGMSRLGIPYAELAKVCNEIRKLDKLKIESIYSHFATAEDQDLTILTQQHQCFEQAIASLEELFDHAKKPLFHLANSAGLMVDKKMHYDMVRPGLALYGLYPAAHFHDKLELKPVMSVKARITQVKTLPKDTGISYGHTFKTERESKIAVVGIGYADGVSRQLSNKLEVLLRGQRVQQVGNITMDQLMLDITDLDTDLARDGHQVEAGEIVTLIGSDASAFITADDWADNLNTISWEVLCGFKNRLPRVHSHSHSNNLD